jgi:hypothetical protein
VCPKLVDCSAVASYSIVHKYKIRTRLIVIVIIIIERAVYGSRAISRAIGRAIGRGAV